MNRYKYWCYCISVLSPKTYFRVKRLARYLSFNHVSGKESNMVEAISTLNELQNGLKSSSRKDKNTIGKDGFMRLLFVKGIRIKLLIIISLLIVGCGNPTQPQSEQPEITEVSNRDQYWISPLGNVFPVTPKWQRGLPVLRGLIRNVSEDTLYNRKMRFLITERDNPDNILSDTFGFFTLDETESNYFQEFPYSIEYDLAPDVIYHIYAAGDTIELDISNTWWYEVVLDN